MVCYDLARDDFLSLLCDCRPVVDRQLLTFFASPKKRKPKKATTKVAALRVPICASQKMGKVRNSLRSNTNFSYPFSAPHKWQRHMRNFRSKTTSKTTSKTDSKTAPGCRKSTCLSIACSERRKSQSGCLVVDFRLPHVALPIVHGRKWKKKRPCLSRRRVVDASHFLTCTSGHPQGSDFSGRLLLLTFSWRSKKSE